MAGLLTFRESIKNFCSKYDKFLSPVVKFLLAFVLFWSLSKMTGYHDTLSKMSVVFAAALVCAFVSEGISLAFAGLYAGAQVFGAGMELAITYFLIFLVMYCVYIRFFPKTAWIIMFMPFLFIVKLQFLMPILVGMIVGVSGIVSVAFGCIFYYVLKAVADYVELQNSGADDLVEGYKYVFQALVENKALILMIVVFAAVVVITSIIYRLSFDYSWYVAIAVGGIFQIILFLVGNFALEADVSLAGALIGTIFAMIIAVIVQFFKAVVDYSRTENTQFEDDEYYYYVKAVPKLVVGKQKKNVRTISSGATTQRPPRPQQQVASAPRAERPVNGSNGATR